MENATIYRSYRGISGVFHAHYIVEKVCWFGDECEVRTDGDIFMHVDDTDRPHKSTGLSRRAPGVEFFAKERDIAAELLIRF